MLSLIAAQTSLCRRGTTRLRDHNAGVVAQWQRAMQCHRQGRVHACCPAHAGWPGCERAHE